MFPDSARKYVNVNSEALASDLFPENFNLGQNYPNPFRLSTKIPVELNQQSHLRLSVYDVLGREVVVLFDGMLLRGRHEIPWHPDGVASGLYLIRNGNRVHNEDTYNCSRKIMCVSKYGVLPGPWFGSLEEPHEVPSNLQLATRSERELVQVMAGLARRNQINCSGMRAHLVLRRPISLTGFSSLAAAIRARNESFLLYPGISLEEPGKPLLADDAMGEPRTIRKRFKRRVHFWKWRRVSTILMQRSNRIKVVPNCCFQCGICSCVSPGARLGNIS